MLTEQQLKELERELDQLRDDMRVAADDEGEENLKAWWERLDQIIFRRIKLQ